MVVTRRTSVPMPPASRTTSNQATPQTNKGSTPNTSILPHEPEDSFINVSSLEARHTGPQFSDDALFSDGSPPRRVPKDRTKVKKRKKEEKTLTRRKKRSTTWVDLLSRMFILGFLIYSLSVCPTADKQTSPVCRALSEYRRLILEPYVISPVQNLIHHPSVSPYTTPIIEKTQPIIARSQHEWTSRIVPQWQTHVTPRWKKHIVPVWNSHVSPQLVQFEAKVDPYRRQAVELYDKHASPYVKQAKTIAYKAQPYVVLAAAKSYDAYQTSKPYFARLYEVLQRVPPVIVKYVINPLVSARRQFVDPHVALLREKIEELSSGATKTNAAPDSDVNQSSTAISKVSKEFEDTSKTVGVEVPVISAPAQGEETLASVASVASASLSLETSAGETLQESSPHINEETEEGGTLASASSIISASLILGNDATESVPGATYSSEAQSDPEPQVSLAVPPSSVSDVATDDAILVSAVSTASTSSQSPLSIPVEVPPQPVNPPSSGSGDDDLDELLAELGLDLKETVASDAPPAPSVVEETEEEKAAREAQRLAIVAEKRRELQARHTKWEEKLAGAIKEQKTVLKEALASVRRTGSAELKINLAIRAAIETLNTEAEKALRGTDAYFTKLKAGGKPRAEQARLWDRVLEKVQAKFEERVDDVEETVNKWYQEEVLSKEKQEIEKASDIVRTVADDAQADIGLDYAWLDDVTHMDWKRYHALLDKHKAFLDEQLALANGSHANAYPNPVLESFDDLQEEVRDITVGFETRMRRIKREGERAFSEERSETEQTAPEVSILPVTDGGKKENQAFQEVADAILGRSGEEVVAALDRAEDQQAKALHEEL